MSDVEEFCEFNGMGLSSYSFGLSCTDLSTLNNSSAESLNTCMEEGVGTTGITWAGNYNVVKTCQPATITVENVPRIIKFANMPFLLKQLKEAGYTVVYGIRVADRYGLRQGRRRMWLHGRLLKFSSPGWQARYERCMEDMAVGPIVHLTKCLMKENSYDLRRHLASIREEKEKREKKMAVKKKQLASKRVKWQTDHWVARCKARLLPPLSLPSDIKEVVDSSHIAAREFDFLRFLGQRGIRLAELSAKRPAMEVKHSIGRLNSLGCTESVSTILHASRQLLLRTKPRRFMTGREGLAIQGIGLEHSLRISNLSEGDVMKVAGDAFSVGVFIASILAGLACTEMSDEDVLEFVGGRFA